MKQLPGSTLSFTRQQISDGFGPADWFPGDHPAMPDIVSHGKRPDARACGLCHMPNGKGRQENAGVSGLPVSYFIQQMNDFRNGLRKSAEPRKANTNAMITIAKAMTPEEIKVSAEYFGAMKWTPWIRVVEASTVPKMVSRGGIWIPVEGGGIGADRHARGRDTGEPGTDGDPARSAFGLHRLRAGRQHQEGRDAREEPALDCGVCHGADLQGLGPVPGIAGRSPSYLARQMFDMQVGARHGEWAELMKPIVAKLTEEDLVNIVAYVASRAPSASGTK